MPTRGPYKRHIEKNKPGAGRPPQEVTRDSPLGAMRLFAAMRDRLDAMVLLRGRRSRANLVEYYIALGLERDERELGITDGWAAKVLRGELPKGLEELNPEACRWAVELYRRAGVLGSPELPPAPKPAQKRRKALRA